MAINSAIYNPFTSGNGRLGGTFTLGPGGLWTLTHEAETVEFVRG